jgi:hypothetical protein
MDKTAFMGMLRHSQLMSGVGKRVGRGSSVKAKLLDDADMNIGNGDTILPSSNNIVITPNTNPTRLLNLDSLSPEGRMMTIAFAAKAIIDPALGGGLPGPLVGIVEFGNGGVFTRVEVDVQVGRVGDFTIQASVEDGVTFVSVPAGVLRAYVRHDGNLVTPSFSRAFGNPGVSAAINGGGNIPDSSGPWQGAGQLPIPAFAQAFVTYYPKYTRRNTRTIIVYRSLGVLADTSGIGEQFYFVPPFVRSVRVLRTPVATSTVTITPRATNQAYQSFTIPAGDPGQIIELASNTSFLGLLIGGTGVTQLALEFEVGM